MRRSACLAAVLVLCLACTATASAVTNTVQFKAQLQMRSAPTADQPAALAWEATQTVDTDPPGEQPNATSGSTWYFPKQVVSNARYFPTCTMAQLDGAPAVPPECQPAIVGNGFSVAYAGQPGSPVSNSVREDMSVTLVNGTPAGQQWLLYLHSDPGAPVAVQRAIPGTVIGASDPYAIAVRFDIPYDLQFQVGLSISLAQFVLNIPSDPHAVLVDGQYYDASFLGMTSCDAAVPAQSTVTFTTDGGYPGVTYPVGTVTATTTVPCALGPGFPYYPPNYPPDSYPTFPPLGSFNGSGGSGAGGAGQQGSGGSTGGVTGSSTPPPTNGSLPPPAPPRITGRSSTKPAIVAGDGTFILPGITVACPASSPGACRVDGTATQAGGRARVSRSRVLAAVNFRLAAGRSSAVRMRLTKQGRKSLGKKHRLKLVVHLRIREPNGAQATKTVSVMVKVRKPRSRH